MKGKYHGAGASVVFKIPFVREFFLFSGHIDAGKKYLEKALKQGHSIGIAIGGEAEALIAENGREAVVLNGRAGFVKLALRHGASLVPTYCFGHNDTFHINKTFLGGIRNWIQRSFKISLPIYWGRWGTPIPLPQKITIVVGKPIPVPQPGPFGEEPSQELIEAYHRRYAHALQELFEKHKKAAGYAHAKLELLDAPGSEKNREKL